MNNKYYKIHPNPINKLRKRARQHNISSVSDVGRYRLLHMQNRYKALFKLPSLKILKISFFSSI